MLYITDAKYEGDYRIWVRFNTGEAGVVELEDDLWGPMFEPLKDKEEFRRFRLSEVLLTIVWDNGADLAPEHLHDKLFAKSDRPVLASSST